MARRSVLFAPADKPDLLHKTVDTDADVVVFDLEDAVVPDAKPEARTAVPDTLTADDFDPDCEVWVRVNPPASRPTTTWTWSSATTRDSTA